MTDIDLSPEAVERLCEMLVQVNKTRHGYSGHPRFNRDGLQAAATLRALSARVEELEAQLIRAKTGLVLAREELDAYSRQEYPGDQPVQQRYRQRDYDANPARVTLDALAAMKTAQEGAKP